MVSHEIDFKIFGDDIQFVEIEISFPERYPFEPPFVRVISPRFGLCKIGKEEALSSCKR